MFGFPTRARLLYHKRPQEWPPRQTVDRDLELAVSMFAPGAETVKERTIHTAIGVAHYVRPRAARSPRPQSARSTGHASGCAATASMSRLQTRAALHDRSVERRPGPAIATIRSMDLRQPKGFVSYLPRQGL